MRRTSRLSLALGTLAAIGLLAVLIMGWQSQPAQAVHTVSGGAPLAHIDQISIDMGPPGSQTATGDVLNGRPAVVDRNADGIPDAEGYDTPDPGDSPGICGNGVDDDLADSDADTAPHPADGTADDG